MTTISLFHQSSLIGLPDARFCSDLEFVVKQRPLACSFTEIGKRRDVIRDVIKGTGYRAVFHHSRETGFIYDALAGMTLRGKGEVRAHRAGPDFPARSITWANWRYREESIWFHTAHWLAHLADSQARVDAHNRLTARMVTLVNKHAQGRDLSFFSGDTNENDRPREDRALGNMHTQFKKGGLRTCWDESGKYPGTFKGRPIDVIGSATRDRGVELRRTSVHNMYADHHTIGAVYTV